MDIPIGPQHAGDDEFTQRMRFHQSWYRAAVLGVEYGCASNGKCYGNLLTSADGRLGLNFLSPDIADVAQRSTAENPRGIERDRLERNLLSSQPMCFNLFGPVACDPEIAPVLVGAILGLTASEVVQVKFEHAPQPTSRYLGDKTAFDVFIEYRLADDSLGFLGVEGKLSEPFSPRPYPLSRYREWVELVGAPWKRDSDDRLDAVEHNQLWRDHMLAFALTQGESKHYSSGKLLLVRHQGDQKTAAAVAGYEDCLLPDDNTFVDSPLDSLVAKWEPVVRGTRWERWFLEMQRRYSDLSGSDWLWKESR